MSPVHRVSQVGQVDLDRQVVQAPSVHQAMKDQRASRLLESTESAVQKYISCALYFSFKSLDAAK